jgi:hypothetical protein
MWIFFMGDLAFIPIEVLIVTIIIDRTIDSREKQQRLEKLNLVIGTFFSRAGNPLLAKLSRGDPDLGNITRHFVIGMAGNPTISRGSARFSRTTRALLRSTGSSLKSPA